jgi:hypothetical protein
VYEFWPHQSLLLPDVYGELSALYTSQLNDKKRQHFSSRPCKNICVTRGKVTLSVPVMQ